MPGSHHRGGRKEQEARTQLASSVECRAALSRLYSGEDMDASDYETLRRVFGGEMVRSMLHDAQQSSSSTSSASHCVT